MMSAVWLALLSAVRERGGSAYDFYRLNTPAGKSTIDKLADVIVADNPHSQKDEARVVDRFKPIDFAECNRQLNPDFKTLLRKSGVIVDNAKNAFTIVGLPYPLIPDKPPFPSFIYAPELIPEYTDKDGNKRKWNVLEDIAPSQFDTNKLKPRSFLKTSDKKGYISGEEMRQRAVEFKGNLGLVDGKRMLAEQDKIPKEFRDFCIPLPGTLLRDSGGRLFVPCLRFGGRRWVLIFGWLGLGWRDGDRLACSEPARNV